ncbi:MAG: VOC family protein [Pseudomonadota bacterium]
MATRRAMPILQVRDVRASAAFYEKIGFQCHGFWGDPPGFAIVQRGDVTLGLFLPESGNVSPNDWWAAYIYVDDVNALHAELAALDLDDISEPRDQEWGCRDFDVVDPDGHRLAFGQDMTPNEHGPGQGPERGRG